MMEKFSSFQKEGGMGLFAGTGGIDFLARDEKSVLRVARNIGKAVKDSSGLMLEMQAEMYGTSARELSALGDLYKQTSGTMIKEVSPDEKERENLENRYNKQIGLENQALRLLGDTFSYMLTDALSPLFRIVNACSVGIIWMAGKFHEFKAFAIPAMVLVTATVVSSVARMSMALYKFALSTIALTTALNARFGASAGSAAGGVVKNVATTVGAEAAGGLLTNLFKRGVVKAGAESIGGTVVKGMFARIFGGIATFFGGAALRGLLGRGLAMLVGACATGGWSLIIGLVVTLIGQFWPNIVSMVKGKGWSINQVGIGKTGPRGESQFAMLIPTLAENIANAVATKDRTKIKDAISTAWQRARLRGTTETDIEAFKVEANRLMNTQVQGFIGYAQRRQAVDPSTIADNLDALNSIKTAVDLVNVTMTLMLDQNKKDIDDAKKREDADKVREERQRVSDMSRLPLPSPVMQGF